MGVGDLVHIVHPYTFQLQGNTLVFGLVEETESRNAQVKSFLETAVESGSRLLHHRDRAPDTIEGAMVDVALRVSEYLETLFRQDVQQVVTTHYGVPIPDIYPDGTSQEFRDFADRTFTKHTPLQKIIGNPRRNFVIGGIYEACVANFANYYAQYYPMGERKIVCIRELCVSLDEKEQKKIEGWLKSKGVKTISYEEAISLLKT